MHKIVLSLGVCLTLNLMTVQLALAQTEPGAQLPDNSSLLSATQVVNFVVSNLTPEQKLLQVIKLARATLQAQVDEELAAPGYKAKLVTTRDMELPLTLVLWDPVSEQLSSVRAIKYRRTLKQVVASPYDIRVRFDNGVNTEFEVANAPAVSVVAILHPVFSDVGTIKKPKFKLTKVVYVPYSRNLNVPTITTAGQDYLVRKIEAVYQELTTLGVRSRTYPDKLLADVIPPTVVKSIIAIEHVSAAALLGGDVEGYLKNFYAVLATNEHQAYAYARSSASARGLVQFIPATYNLVVRKRPELTLHRDFEQGMTDPYNAIKATIGLLDMELATLSPQVREIANQDEVTLGAYLAAMYNAGSTRVRRAITKHGIAWDKYYGRNANSLRLETSQYVSKYRLLHHYFEGASLHLAAAQP